MLSSQLVKIIRRYRKDQKLSGRGYAREADVSEITVRGIDGDDWNPTLKTIKKLEAVIPPHLVAKYMAEANDNQKSSDPKAARSDRGDDQNKAA